MSELHDNAVNQQNQENMRAALHGAIRDALGQGVMIALHQRGTDAFNEGRGAHPNREKITANLQKTFEEAGRLLDIIRRLGEPKAHEKAHDHDHDHSHDHGHDYKPAA